MKFRSQLLLTGLPLLVVPVLASLAIVWVILSQQTVVSQFNLLDTQVDLVHGRLSWDYELLSRAGLQEDVGSRENVTRRLSASLEPLVGSDVRVVLLNHQREVILGPASWVGKALPVSDPLQAVYTKTRGHLEEYLSLDAQHGRWLLSWVRFESWNWTVAALVPVAHVQAAVVSAVFASLGATLFLLAAGVVVFLVVSRVMTRPLTSLQKLAHDFGEGNLNLRAELRGNDEVTALAKQWNLMAEQIQGLTVGLEERVAERNRELKETLEASRTLHVQLMQSEKMAALGELVAGVAHELNSPLAAIASAGGILRASVDSSLFDTMDSWAGMDDADRGLVRNLLGRGGSREYLAASSARQPVKAQLAQLLSEAGASEAHTLAETLLEAGVSRLEPGDLTLLCGPTGMDTARMAASLFSIRFSAHIVEDGVERLVKVIQALRDYSRFDAERQRECVNLEDSIETVLTLLNSRLRGGVQVVRSFSPDSCILADPDRLGQLWINLIGNALYAMEGKGTLELRAETLGTGLRVQVIDSGTGIPEELQGRIFQPYFTTKKRGEGTGLGLMICRSIVEESGGTLTFQSRPGRTVFEAHFPERCDTV